MDPAQGEIIAIGIQPVPPPAVFTVFVAQLDIWGECINAAGIQLE